MSDPGVDAAVGQAVAVGDGGQVAEGVVDLLGALAYGELSAFDRLAEDARTAPTLAGRAALSQMAAAEIGHYALLERYLEGDKITPQELEETLARSDRIIMVPIGDKDTPLGYIELSNSPIPSAPMSRISSAKIGISVVLVPKKVAAKSSAITASRIGVARRKANPSFAARSPRVLIGIGSARTRIRIAAAITATNESAFQR